MPVINGGHPELKNRAKVEGEFFNSLGNLAALYGFEAERYEESVYPYNLHLAFDHAKNCMEKIAKNLEVQVIQDETHIAVLTTLHTLSTGQQLYYLPVKPLWNLLQDKRKKAIAKLLLSLFANLYRRGVASFRDGNSFLSGNYEMLTEWITDSPGEWEEADYLQVVSDLNRQSVYGDKLFRSIRHPYTARQFAPLVSTFVPDDELEQELAGVSLQFHRLFEQFPDASFHDHMYPDFADTEDNQVMFPDYYLSFYWTDNDSNSENLMENVNSTLNECTVMIEPMTLHFFDKPQERQREDCFFESRFLLLTDYLCEILFRMS